MQARRRALRIGAAVIAARYARLATTVIYTRRDGTWESEPGGWSYTVTFEDGDVTVT